MANLFRVASSSTPSISSTEATKGNKCWSFWRKSSSYIFYFDLSASWRHFYGVLSRWDLALVFPTRILWTLSLPFCQRSRIRRSPFCYVSSDFCFVGVCVYLDRCAIVLIDVVPDEVIWKVNWLHYLNYEPIARTSSTRHLVRTRNVLGQTVSSYGWCNGIPLVFPLFRLFSEQFSSDRIFYQS